MLLEQGNTSDSASLLPLTKLHEHNTGVIPGFVSADDGYSSKEGFDACLRQGVENICLSGSEGKKIIPGELNNRSGNSSLKKSKGTVCHEFGRFLQKNAGARCNTPESGRFHKIPDTIRLLTL